jgi:hypothetical protein
MCDYQIAISYAYSQEWKCSVVLRLLLYIPVLTSFTPTTSLAKGCLLQAGTLKHLNPARHPFPVLSK